MHATDPRSPRRLTTLLGLAGAAQAAPDLRTRLPIVVMNADGPIVDDPKVGARLRRWPVLGFTPLDPRASDATLRASYRAEADRLRTWLRVRSGWLTANLPRIGRL